MFAIINDKLSSGNGHNSSSQLIGITFRISSYSSSSKFIILILGFLSFLISEIESFSKSL